jgi:hypothetical protein
MCLFVCVVVYQHALARVNACICFSTCANACVIACICFSVGGAVCVHWFRCVRLCVFA